MIGSRIAFLRQQAELTQDMLARAVGVTAPALGAYEQGRRTPSAAILTALADALDVSIDFLLTGTPGSARELSVAVAMQLTQNGSTASTNQMLAFQIFLRLTGGPFGPDGGLQ